jgi:hypothetical protein
VVSSDKLLHGASYAVLSQQFVDVRPVTYLPHNIVPDNNLTG